MYSSSQLFPVLGRPTACPSPKDRPSVSRMSSATPQQTVGFLLETVSPVSLVSFYASCSDTTKSSDDSRGTIRSVSATSDGSCGSGSMPLTFQRSTAIRRRHMILDESPCTSSPSHNSVIPDNGRFGATTKHLDFTNQTASRSIDNIAQKQFPAGESTSSTRQVSGHSDRTLHTMLPFPLHKDLSQAVQSHTGKASPDVMQSAYQSAGASCSPAASCMPDIPSDLDADMLAAISRPCTSALNAKHQHTSPLSQLSLMRPSPVQFLSSLPATQESADVSQACLQHLSDTTVITSNSEDEDTKPLVWTATQTPRRRVAIAIDSDSEAENGDTTSTAKICSSAKCSKETADNKHNTAHSSDSASGPTPPWMSSFRPHHPPVSADGPNVATLRAAIPATTRGSAKPVQRVLFSEASGEMSHLSSRKQISCHISFMVFFKKP
jgi:hypothetical protein